MSEQDNYIDELFEKAKTAPPVLSLSEVKDLLKEPAVRKNRSNRRWIYFSLSCFLALILVTLYKYSGEERRAKMLPHFATNTITSSPVPQKNEKASVVQSEKSNLEETSRENETLTIAKPVRPATIDVPERVGKDIVKIDSLANKNPKPAITNKTTEMGIMIPWFADQEMLKVYQDKLAASGITLEIKELKYTDNTARLGKSKTKSSSISNKKFISFITANISVKGVFYKSIQVNNFKEIRIVWETSADGKVKIKSLTYLDENFMSRKL